MAVTFISIAGGGSNGKDQPGEEILEGEGGVMMEDVAHVVAGKEQKIAFCEILFEFLERH